jgi:LysM repeat protein
MTSDGSNTPKGGVPIHLIAPAALAVLLVAVVFVVLGSLGEDDKKGSTPTTTTAARKLPIYWRVKRGDTFGQIADKTGLSLDDLETFNPTIDPNNLLPGQKVKLRLNIPKPKPRPKGPKFYTVRPGDSYGSIAGRFGKDINKLQDLNPTVLATNIQPGDRIQLRE